jgi:hypothetical protein
VAEQQSAPARVDIIRPPSGSKSDDFQLAYAVQLMDGKRPPARTASNH